MSATRVTPAKVKSALKTGSRHYVGDVAGRPFVGNEYFAVAADRPGPARDLLAQYNVPATYRGLLEVNGTVTVRPESEPPPLERLFLAPSTLTALRPLTLTPNGPGVMVHGVDGALLAVYTADDGRRTYANVAFLDAMGAATLHQLARATETAPGTVPALTAIIGRDPAGEVVGIVMTVRVQGDGR